VTALTLIPSGRIVDRRHVDVAGHLVRVH